MRPTTVPRLRADIQPWGWSADRILQLIDLASDDTFREGLDWYQTAHDHATRLASEHDVTVRQASGIIAALSPCTGWEQNLADAAGFLAGDRGLHTPLFEGRADAIYRNSDTDPLAILGGYKVRSFYRNIYQPDRPGPVTIDRHAVAALCGRPTPEVYDICRKLLDRRTAYLHAASYYRRAARELDLLPHEAQAIAWLAQRERDPKAIPDF